MPGASIAGPQVQALLALLRTFTPAPGHDVATMRVQTVDGGTLEGRVVSRSTDELQLQSTDGRLHLLRRTGEQYRRVTSQVDWPTYNGQPGGNRFSTLDEINRESVVRLAPRWMFSLPGAVSPRSHARRG